jgi:hypothetical protein
VSHDAEEPPRPWEPGGVEFLGEQRGPAEDLITTALTARFAADPRIRAAYLVRAIYPIAGPQRAAQENRGRDGTAAPVEVVVCVAAPEDPAIAAVVGEEFRKLFHTSQHLDVLFLTDAQEREVRKVAAPFYSTNASG